MGGGPEQGGHRLRRGGGWTPAPSVAAGLLVVVALTFANAVGNDFVFDDYLLVVDDPAVRVPLRAGLSTGSYRPLRTLSYRLDYALGGMSPRIFHVSNIVYHGVTVLLVCAAVRASGASIWGAAAGALIFAVHPVQTEAVTYVSGRRDLLCGLFFIAGYLAYLGYRRGGGWRALLLVIAAYALAVLSKEMAVTLPLVCLLFDRWQVRRGQRGEERPSDSSSRMCMRAALAVVVITGAAVLALAYWAHAPHISRLIRWHGGSVGANFATVARVWAHYLWLLVWPARLTADYSDGAFAVSTHALDPRALGSAAIVALLAIGAWRSWRRGGLARFGAAWWAVTLLPVSHLIPYRELLAEHYLYLPMCGVAFLVAGAVDGVALRAPERRRLLALGVLAVACALAVRTAARNRDWRDQLTLWSATTAAVPKCARAQFNLGQAYYARNRLAEAERSWRAAQALKPSDPGIMLALANASYRLGRYDRARADVAQALRLRPNDPEAETLAGWIELDSGNPGRAVEYFDSAIVKLPEGKRAPAQLGRSLAVRRLEPRALSGEELGRRSDP